MGKQLHFLLSLFHLLPLGEGTVAKEIRKCSNFHQESVGSGNGSWAFPAQMMRDIRLLDDIPSKCDEELMTSYNIFESNESSSRTNLKAFAFFSSSGIINLNDEYFYRDEFCVESLSKESLGLKVCDVDCGSRPCIPICCSLDKGLYLHFDKSINSTVERCVPMSLSSTPYSPTLHSDDDMDKEHDIHFYQQKLSRFSCNWSQIHSYPLRKVEGHFSKGAIVRLLVNGKMKMLRTVEREWEEYHEFCVSPLLNDSLFYGGREQDQIIYVCGDYSNKEVVAPYFYVPVYMLNSLFLLATAAVYLCLWEKQNIHGYVILSFVLAMLFMWLFLCWSYLRNLLHLSDVQVSPGGLCIFVGVAAHFFFIATFSWSSVVNFDLWWTFRSMSPTSGRGRRAKRFICYLIFGWGTPVVIVSLGALVTYIYPDPLSEVKIPGYGAVTCFLEPTAKGIYLYGVIGVLVGINLSFMFLTLYTIYKFKQSTRPLESARSNNAQTLSAKLFFKLFVVMGVSWGFEVVTWWNSAEETLTYWIVLDLFTFLQSFGVFLIFVCKRKILNLLEQKYPSLKVITGPLKKLSLGRRATRTVTATTTLISDRKPFTATFSAKKNKLPELDKKQEETTTDPNATGPAQIEAQVTIHAIPQQKNAESIEEIQENLKSLEKDEKKDE